MAGQDIRDRIQKAVHIHSCAMASSRHTSMASVAAPPVPPRRSARHASSRTIKTLDTTILKQYTGFDWKTDAEIQVWVLSDSVKPYLEQWKTQYLDDPDYLRNLRSLLVDESTDWVQQVPLISRYRHNEDTTDLVADTSEWPVEKILCRIAALIVRNDRNGMLSNAEYDADWSLSTTICLLLMVLQNLLDSPEGFISSEMLEPLQTGWGSGSTQSEEAV